MGLDISKSATPVAPRRSAPLRSTLPADSHPISFFPLPATLKEGDGTTFPKKGQTVVAHYVRLPTPFDSRITAPTAAS